MTTATAPPLRTVNDLAICLLQRTLELVQGGWTTGRERTLRRDGLMIFCTMGALHQASVERGIAAQGPCACGHAKCDAVVTAYNAERIGPAKRALEAMCYIIARKRIVEPAIVTGFNDREDDVEPVIAMIRSAIWWLADQDKLDEIKARLKAEHPNVDAVFLDAVPPAFLRELLDIEADVLSSQRDEVNPKQVVETPQLVPA